MQVLTRLFLIFSCLCGGLAAQAQLKVDTSVSVDNLVRKVLMGKGVQVGNIRLKGGRAGIAQFRVSSDVIGMRDGLLLATGRTHDAIGPNNTPGRSGIVSTPQTLKTKEVGDADLNRLCGNKTLDVMVLEFDFVPMHNTVSFRYCFGSEEYREYVGSRFNDVFGFFIQGPGLPKQNLAVIPGTAEPVAVNNVNHQKYRKIYLNNDYFVDRKAASTKSSLFQKTSLNEDAVLVDERERRRLNQELAAHFQYDGFTRVLTARCHVIPHQKYHLKLAIGDVGDYALDSGVFLEAGSFSSGEDPAAPTLQAAVGAEPALLELAPVNGNKPDPQPEILQKEICVFRTLNVHFATDSYEIPDSAKTELDQLAAHLAGRKALVCQLYGHTDNVGGKVYNQQLSENRALAVIKYLISQGIPLSRLSYVGHNYADPIADNDHSSGRRYNRRVEVNVVEAEMQASGR